MWSRRLFDAAGADRDGYGFYRFGAKVYMDSNYPIYFKGYIVNGELTTVGSNLPAWLP